MSQRHFQDELDKLKASLVGMAGLAEDAVRRAVAALLDRSPESAEEVIAADDRIDELEMSIDAIAINLLALQQPMARDLRLIAMSMKISSDLERVGDHAVNIAETVKWLASAPPFPTLPEIEEMSRLANDMLADSLNAFVVGDAQLARDVLRRDDRVDELHDNNFRILLTHMMEDPRKITAGMDLLLISGNLERIADLATNISEDVVYLIEGRTIKHHVQNRAPGRKETDVAH
ncbi:MAG TPA: phosphate signaling complex protein PhoU [Longimicrobiales bacterium]|nr:phosphate signaling complex protein PhoU [Longimicrobiales bacterium]